MGGEKLRKKEVFGLWKKQMTVGSYDLSAEGMRSGTTVGALVDFG